MRIIRTIISADSTKKYYFKTVSEKKEHIEACLLNLPNYGYIICVSSQIGCSQQCRFCASGCKPFIRNLSSLEMEEQVALIIDDNPSLYENGFQVTYMGSGEPLVNYENVFASIDSLRKKYNTLQKVNISTTYPISFDFQKIDWSKYKNFLHFQYSLHFAKDDDRKKYLSSNLLTINEAILNLNIISSKINDRYKINYIPFDRLNDSAEDINLLHKIVGNSQNAILKISEMSEIDNCKISSSKSFNEFAKKIIQNYKDVEIFKSSGKDVNAGCGQFYNESIM